MSPNLTVRTFRGLKWSYVGTLLFLTLQVGYTAVMARLLTPSDFGLVAMGNVLLRFISYFAQMGMGQVIVQRGMDKPEEIRAAFTMTMVLSCAATTVFWFLAPLSILLYKSSDVIPVARALSFSFIFMGFSTVATSLLRRGLEFGKLAIIDSVSFFIGFMLVGIPLAISGYGVWALIGSTLAQMFFQGVLAYAFCPHAIRPALSLKSFSTMVRSGSRFSLVSFIQFLYYSVQPLVIARRFGSDSLGIFNNALRLANLPIESFTSAITKVIFPSFSSINQDKGRLKSAFVSSHLLLFSFIGPLAIGMAAASTEIVYTVLGDQWTRAIEVLRILAIAAPFSLMLSLTALVYDSTGFMRIRFGSEVLTLLPFLIGSYFLAADGMSAIIMFYAVFEFLKYVTYLVFLRRPIALELVALVPGFVVIAFNTFIVAATIWLVHLVLQAAGLPVGVILAFQIVFAGSAFIMVTFVKPMHALRSELTSLCSKMVGEQSTGNRSGSIIVWYSRYLLASQKK